MTKKVKEILEKVKSKEIVTNEHLDGVFYTFEEDTELEDFTKMFKETKINIFKNIFSIPALFLHELFHIIFSLILFRKMESVEVTSPMKKNFCVRIYYKNIETSSIRNILIGFAPILVLFLAVGLCFVSCWFVIFLGYVVLNIGTVVPSKIDIVNVLIFKYKSELSEEDFSIFTDECYKLKYKDLI